MNRTASSARKIAANAIKKMHVPAYWPLVLGVQFIEKSGVAEEKKNVIAMKSMPIMGVEVVDIDELVELAIEMPVIVLVGDINIDMDIGPIELVIDISMARLTIQRIEAENWERKIGTETMISEAF